MSARLPTEPGVYIPATTRTVQGPVVFVLYGGGWRVSPHPDGYTAFQLARDANERWGLKALVDPETLTEPRDVQHSTQTSP